MADEHNQLLAYLLASEAQSRLRTWIKTAALQQGQVLAEPLEPIDQVYFPHSGAISFLVPLRDGRLVQTGVVGRDGAVGAMQALGSNISSNRIVVQVAGQAAVMQAKHLAEIVREYPALRPLIVSHEQFFISEVQQSAACNAVHTVQERACRWILRMNDLVGMNVAMTQELIAGMIGVRRTSVSAAAASLQEQGIIRYRRGHIQIVDLERLKQSSCECYRTLKQYQHIVQPPDAAEGAGDASR